MPHVSLTADPDIDPVLAELLRRYEAGPDLVDAALAGATDADLDRLPAASAGGGDGWSARMVAHHLADSETNSYVRLRRLLAESPAAALQAYDEAAWAESLRYDLPVEPSLAVFRAVRASSAQLLGAVLPGMTEGSAREVRGTHSESGAYSLLDWLQTYAAHAEDHAAQIRAARGAE